MHVENVNNNGDIYAYYKCAVRSIHTHTTFNFGLGSHIIRPHCASITFKRCVQYQNASDNEELLVHFVAWKNGC